MLKVIIIIIIVVIIAVAVYYGRFLFTKKVVNEELPEPTVSAPPTVTTSPAPAASPGTSPSPSPSPQATLQTLRQGSFNDIDFIHKGSGKALLLESGAKKYIRFEDFKVTNGPDLYVYLTKTENPKDDISKEEFLNLGRLKGTVGNQNYEVNQDITGYNTVVIWCRQFSALFSYAALK